MSVARQRHRHRKQRRQHRQHRQRRHSLDRPDKMARKGSPESRDNRGIQASLAPGGKQARPDDRVTRVMREIRDGRATPVIEASPLHAPTDSIATLILTTEG